MKWNAAGWLLLLLVTVLLTGCKEENKEQSLPTEVVEAEKATEPTKEEEVEEVADFGKAPLVLTKSDQKVYENENGNITFLGYTTNGFDEYLLVFSFKDAMADATNTQMELNVITEDGESERLTAENRVEIRKVNEKERLHIYNTKMTSAERKLVRLDVTPGNKRELQNGNFDTTRMEDIVLMLPETSETIEVDGVPSVAATSSKMVDITKETTYATLHIEGVTYYDETQSLFVAGEIEYKEDREDEFKLTYLVPSTNDAGEIPMQEVVMEDRYAGTKVPFNQEIMLKEPLAEDDGRFYFAIDGVFVAFDLASGEELNEADVTQFPMEGSHFIEYPQNLFGFSDVNGAPQYDAFYTLDNYAEFDKTEVTQYQFVVGSGYDTLTFEVGPSKNDSLNKQGYLIEVVEEGYDLDDDGYLVGEPLLRETIKADDEMKTVTVDTDGLTKVNVLVSRQRERTMNDFGFGNHIPILIKDVTISK